MAWIKKNSIVKCFFKNVYILFSNVLRHSGVHGIKYVFDTNSPRATRFLWSVILILFSGYLYSLLVPVIRRGKEVSFVADSGYLHWQVNFPAVTLCETFSHKRVGKKLAEEYPKLIENLNYGYRRHIADLLFGRGSCSKSVCTDCGNQVACNMPWRDLIERVHRNCTEMLSDCRFNNQMISCCEEFITVDSVSGPCFTFNTLQSKKRSGNSFLVNRTTGPGLLSFRLLADSQLAIHSSEESSTSYLDKKYKFDIKISEDKYVSMIFNTVQVEIEPLLRDEDINIRKCRDKDEIPDELLYPYPVYSYGACRLTQSTYKSFHHCGCVHPARDVSYKDMYCNYTGINCLVIYNEQKIKLGITEESYFPVCLPACEESEINVIHYSKRSNIDKNSEGSLVEIKMAALPTLKYTKRLMRTKLDLVVTVGGMVALFFSASILSLVEILYLMLRSK